MLRKVRVKRAAAALMVSAAAVSASAACSSGKGDATLDIAGVRACDTLKQDQLETYGVTRVTQDGTGLAGFNRCTWQSPPGSLPLYSLSVSIDPRRDNSWVGEKSRIARISGFRSSQTGSDVWVATGPDHGMIGVEALSVKRPAREIAQAVVDGLKQRP